MSKGRRPSRTLPAQMAKEAVFCESFFLKWRKKVGYRFLKKDLREDLPFLEQRPGTLCSEVGRGQEPRFYATLPGANSSNRYVAFFQQRGVAQSSSPHPPSLPPTLQTNTVPSLFLLQYFNQPTEGPKSNHSESAMLVPRRRY